MAALTAAQITQLESIRANLITTLLTESAAPKPSYTIGNQTVSWTEYYAWKWKAITDIDDYLQENEDGAWEIRSIGVP